MNTTDVIIGKRKAVSNWLLQSRIYVNLEKQVYKIHESLLGIFRWGSYKPLPKIDYVLVFKQLFAKCETCSLDDYESDTHSYFQVSLVYGHNRRIVVHETKNKEEAFGLAGGMAAGLKLRVKDAASDRRKSTWL